MVKNKKILTIIAALCTFLIGISVHADSSNDLLKLDVKRSTASDTVDVTFYTTGGSYNSVVTRKSDNKYVVLLPNTSGSSSIVPGLGGVKDLISDINVKNVDDGIGGYTKVTFTTTKPIKIQTFTKKTAPLTKAQEEYKNLIAKHETVPAIRKNQTSANNASNTNTKPVSNTAKPTPVKPAVDKTVQNNTQKTEPKNNTNKTNKTDTKTVAQNTKPSAILVQTKPVETTKPKINIPTEEQNTAPKTEETINNNKPTIEDSKPKVIEPKTITPTKEESKTNSDTKPAFKLPLLGALAVLGLFLLAGIFNIIARFAGKNSKNIKEILDTPPSNQSSVDTKELKNIINDDTLNWQEKYKKYTETEKKSVTNETKDMYTFLTDISGEKKTVVFKKNSDTNKSPMKKNIAAKVSQMEQAIKNNSSANKSPMKKNIAARISQMEHALSQTPSMEIPEFENKNTVKSEENAITQKMSGVKLKSFAKSKSLRETSRSLYNEFKQESQKDTYKEGRFVKLKNSPLSENSRRANAKTKPVTDVIKAENNNTINKLANNVSYSSSSLGEYFSLLDSEPAEKIANSFSKYSRGSSIKNTSAMTTNPIARPEKSENQNTNQSDFPSMEGMKIQSSFIIDSQRGFYIVDIDDKSALIGKNGNNISLIKNFETKIYKPIQVRRDYNSVYIVRVGEFKCLVDTSAPKFGVLLEI